VESITEGRSYVMQGCYMQNTDDLKRSIEMLVDMLLDNAS